MLLLLVATVYDPLTSTADAKPAEAATVEYAGEPDDWSLLDPNDKSVVTPVFFEFILSRDGAGAGANAFNTSLNLSTDIPIVVFEVKSVKRPSV